MEISGYDPDERFFATRYVQGGRTVYAVDLSLTQIASLIPAPEANKATEGNRLVKESHARAFGEYVRNRSNWVAPALVLRAPDIFKFEIRESVAGTDFGILSFPKMASTDLKILDGQHRTLGIHLAIRGIAEDLERHRSSLSAARRNEDSVTMANIQARIDELAAQRERFSRERTSLQIFVEDDRSEYRQMFFDIADNALGITGAVRARFDNSKVVNRSLEPVMDHALFKGRVDPEQDRVTGNNPNLLGAKQVAEIIRTLIVGLDGRVGRRLEDELKEDALVQKTNDFLDTLVAAFPPLTQLADGGLAPELLRKSSMLGSTVMIRVLAGVYAELVDRHKFDEQDVVEFFSLLAPHMNGPVQEDGIWIKYAGGDIFTLKSFAPQSRRQNLKALRDKIIDWATTDPAWLRENTNV